MRLGDFRDVFRSAFRDDSSATVARFRPEIDDPVGQFDHVEIVLDEHERVTGVHQSIEDLRQLENVLEMQAGRRLVHEIQLAAGFPPRRGELARDLHALGFAARQCRRWLAETQVPQSHLL
ncbi:MAG TPA: hypothetical protein VJ867_07230 [Gemmatimonadaceae bacterium]|nr:hypothetical protein [Gemmatimonadaceae bacterium]